MIDRMKCWTGGGCVAGPELEFGADWTEAGSDMTEVKVSRNRTILKCVRRRLEFGSLGLNRSTSENLEKHSIPMNISRFSLVFLACCLPALAQANPVGIQDANQSFRQGNHSAALSKVNGFLANNPKDAQGRFLKGLILTELNRYAEAIKVFSELTDDYPELPEPYNNLAVLYAAQADYERAKQSLEMAIRTHPSYTTAHENLGDIYAKMASQAYDKALQLDKSNTSAQTKLALIRDLFSSTPRTTEPPKVVETKPEKPKPVAAPVRVADTTTPPPTPAVEASENVPTAENPSQAIESTIHAWAKAWSNRDVEAYLSFYSGEFKVADREAWASLRRERLTKPTFIKVEIDRLKISVQGDQAQASFRQRYASNTFKSNDTKTLGLAREGDAWKIVEER